MTGADFQECSNCFLSMRPSQPPAIVPEARAVESVGAAMHFATPYELASAVARIFLSRTNRTDTDQALSFIAINWAVSLGSRHLLRSCRRSSKVG